MQGLPKGVNEAMEAIIRGTAPVTKIPEPQEAGVKEILSNSSDKVHACKIKSEVNTYACIACLLLLLVDSHVDQDL